MSTTPYRAIVLPYASADTQKSVYSTYLKSYDLCLLRVAAGTKPSSTYLNVLNATPALKGLELRSIPEIQAAVNAKYTGVSVIGYVPEPEHGTPQSEMDDIVNSVKKASQIVRAAGMKFEIVPRLQTNIDHAKELSPVADYYTIMSQSYQNDLTKFKAWVQKISTAGKSTNPNIPYFCEVSTERSALPGYSQLTSFEKLESAVISAGYANGASIWMTSSTLGTVKSFLNWYNTKYGR